MGKQGDYLTLAAASRQLDVRPDQLCSFIGGGGIPARKEKGKWRLAEPDVLAFKHDNEQKLQKLRAEYILLYSQGVTVSGLKGRAKDDLINVGAVHRSPKSFAEYTIYEHIMAQSRRQQ